MEHSQDGTLSTHIGGRSACKNNLCPSSGKCLRFNGKRDEFWQSFDDFTPDDTGRCHSFIQISVEDERELERLREDRGGE